MAETKKKKQEPKKEPDQKEAAKAIQKAEKRPEQSIIKSMEDLHLFATAVFKSGYFPDIKSAAQAFLRIKVGMELGLPEMAALRLVSYIEKTKDFVIETSAFASLAMDRGIRWKKLTPKGKENEGCWLEIYKPGSDIPPVRVKFTKEEAKRAGLLHKDNWQKYPQRMYFKRALKFGLNEFDPRIDMGYYSREELEGVEPFKQDVKQDDQEFEEAEIVEEEEGESFEDEEIIDEVEEEESENVEGPGGKTYTTDMDKAEQEPWDEGERQPGDDEEEPPEKEAEETTPDFDKKTKLFEANISAIKERHSARGGKFKDGGPYDIKVYKKWLYDKQVNRIFVGINQYGKISFHSGKTEDVDHLQEKSNMYFRKFCKDLNIDPFGKPVVKKEDV